MDNPLDPAPAIDIRVGDAQSFGWLRRPELEKSDGIFIFEKPNGELFATKFKRPRVARANFEKKVIDVDR